MGKWTKQNAKKGSAARRAFGGGGGERRRARGEAGESGDTWPAVRTRRAGGSAGRGGAVAGQAERQPTRSPMLSLLSRLASAASFLFAKGSIT